MSLAASYSIAAIFSGKDKLSPAINKIEKKYGSFAGVTGRAVNKLNIGFNKLAKVGAAGAVAIGAAAAASAVGVYKLTESVATAGDEIAKTSRAIGISAEALQEFRFAADRQGVSSETLTKSLEKLNKNVGDLRAGSGTLTTLLNKTDPAFSKLLKNAGSNEEAFDLLMNQINKMPNQFDKSALAVAAFGRSGQDLLKLFEAGPDGIKDLREEALKLGGVMSTEAANAAEKFIDAQANLKFAMSGVKNTIGNALIPAFTDLVTGFKNLVIANKDLIKIKTAEIIGKIETKIRAFITQAGGAEGIFEMMRSGFSKVVEFGKKTANTIKKINVFVEKMAGWKTIGKVILGLAVAVKVLSAALVIMNVAAGPINWTIIGVVAAITALVAVTTIIIKHWDKVSAAFKRAGGFIKQNKELFLSLLGPIGAVISVVINLVKRFGEIKKAFQTEGIIGGLKKIAEVIFDSLIAPFKQFLELLGNLNPFGEASQERRQERRSNREERRAEQQRSRLSVATNAAEEQSKMSQIMKGEGIITVKSEDGQPLEVDNGTMPQTGWSMEDLGKASTY